VTVRRVGGYDVIEELGRGGMAIVYLARQRELARDVALKELLALHSGDPDGVRRFLRESRLAGSLSHPCIVTVYDLLEADGTPYIAMEYLERGTLRPWVGKLSTVQIIGVLRDVLSGLAHAARRGIVHRDLKPENLLVTDEGGVKITDFGIAKAVGQAADTKLTHTGTAMGTPAYMAPEQAMGTEVGPATDLYALGVIAYELLAGRPPFKPTGTPMAVLLRHVQEPVPPLLSVAPHVDPELAGWVEALLAKKPEDRPPSADAARERLEEIAFARFGPRWQRDTALAEPKPPVDSVTGFETYTPPGREPAAEPVVAAEPVAAEPLVAEPVAAEPVAAEPQPQHAVTEPVAAEPQPERAVTEPVAAAPPPQIPTPVTSPAPPAPTRPPAPSARRRPRAALLAGVAAAAVAVIVVVLLLAGGGGGKNSSKSSVVKRRPPAPAITTTKVGAQPDGILVANGQVYVCLDSTGELVRLSPRASVKIGDQPDSVAYGAGRLWVTATGANTVTPVDPASMRVAHPGPVFVHDSPEGVAVGFGSVWVAGLGGDAVDRLNQNMKTAHDDYQATFDHLSSPVAIAIGPRNVWVATRGAVVRVDPANNTVSDQILTGDGTRGAVVAGRFVYAISAKDRTIVRINPATLRVVGRRTLPGSPRGLAAGGGAVWVTLGDTDQLLRIDPATLAVTATHRTGHQPLNLAVGAGAVWTSNYGSGTVTRVPFR
jgi:hypothetical protein